MPVPELQGDHRGDLLRQAQSYLAGVDGTQAQKAELWQKLFEKVNDQSPGFAPEPYKQEEYTAKNNGETVFVGPGGPAIVIDKDGNVWRGGQIPNEAYSEETGTLDYKRLRKL